MNYRTKEEGERIKRILSDRFRAHRLWINGEQNSPTICVSVVTGQGDSVASSEIADCLANNGFKVEVVNDWDVEVNPEHFATVAEWRFPPGFLSTNIDDAWIYIMQERDCKRLQVWLDGGDGANIFDCTDLKIGRKALQAWDDAGRPPLNRDLPPNEWPFPKGDENWSAAEAVES